MRRIRLLVSRFRRDESGQAGLLTLGFTVVSIMLILVTSAVTAAQLARMQLLDTADAAALDAADALDGGVYTGGVGDAVPVSDTSVRESAQTYLSTVSRPGGITSWQVAPGTGSPDGEVAVVVLTGTASLPFVESILDAVGGSVTITVESRARAGLDP